MASERLALQAIVNILSDLKDDQNNPLFKEIDEYHGQYEDENGN